MTDQQPQNWDDQPGQVGGTNVLGIVGFVLSFCLSPIGLILSLIGLTKSPRGFAIAGVVIGLLGTIVWVVVGATFVFAGDAMAKGFALAADYQVVQTALEAHARANNGEAPADLAAANVPADALTDPWNNAYKYERDADGKGWTFTSAGFDGQFGNADDGVFRPGMTQGDISNAISRMMEGHFRKTGGASPAPAPAPAQPAPAESK